MLTIGHDLLLYVCGINIFLARSHSSLSGCTRDAQARKDETINGLQNQRSPATCRSTTNDVNCSMASDADSKSNYLTHTRNRSDRGCCFRRQRRVLGTRSAGKQKEENAELMRAILINLVDSASASTAGDDDRHQRCVFFSSKERKMNGSFNRECCCC